MKYLFDSNIFIRSKNEMPMDTWPTFWTRMTEMIMAGQVYISVKVKQEIENGNDELTDWLKKSAPQSCFVPIDSDILIKYGETQNWAALQPFKEQARQVFAQVADAYIVATAAAKNMTLVTYEKSNPLSKSRVMIPDACDAIGADYCDLNAALRGMNIKI
jgi:predicted nucleic acid-binding protein